MEFMTQAMPTKTPPPMTTQRGPETVDQIALDRHEPGLDQYEYA